MTERPVPLVVAEELMALVLEGEYEKAAKEAIELGLDLVPVETLRGYLTDAAARRADAIADAAERAKVGP